MIEEAHAELAFAEITACNSLLVITSDQSIGGYVRAAIKIRSSHQAYKECSRIMKSKKDWQSESTKKHFESGLYLGTFDAFIPLHSAQ